MTNGDDESGNSSDDDDTSDSKSCSYLLQHGAQFHVIQKCAQNSCPELHRQLDNFDRTILRQRVSASTRVSSVALLTSVPYRRRVTKNSLSTYVLSSKRVGVVIVSMLAVLFQGNFGGLVIDFGAQDLLRFRLNPSFQRPQTVRNAGFLPAILLRSGHRPVTNPQYSTHRSLISPMLSILIIPAII